MEIDKNKLDPQVEHFDISLDVPGYISWLKSRINKTEKELDQVTDLHLKIGKGAKLCVYKESLNYVLEHSK